MPKLLDRVRQETRKRNYSSKTEEAYVLWIKRFIIFHGKKRPTSF
ncbi:MAG: phage integrase N-terminal SAM-like domain-containing protein [Bacteroidetes bacterium]|nr:phage integrase N-terminal SAM-like domain-containing protein [Bacteroidota bacterium]